MIGGHEKSVYILMDFFDGMKIINRTEYPFYAFNIILELRKYNNIFYIEIYYNDFLKYNETLEKFKDILIRSKYNNTNNYCKNFNDYKSNKYINKRFGIKVILIVIIIVGFIAVISYYLFVTSDKRKYISLRKIINFKNENNFSKDKINYFHDLVYM